METAGFPQVEGRVMVVLSIICWMRSRRRGEAIEGELTCGGVLMRC